MSSRSHLGPSGAGAFGNPLKSRLGRRLLTWFLLFSLVPLVGSNMVGYLESRGIIEEHVQRHLGAIAEIEARHVREQVARAILELQAITAGNEFLVAGALRASGAGVHPMGAVADRRAVEVHLGRKLDELGEFEALFLQDHETSILAAAGPRRPGVTLDPGRQKAEPRFETVRLAGDDGAPTFRLSVPVRTADGRVAGYLVGLMSAEGFRQLVDLPEHTAGSIESFIVDPDGRLLYVSHPHGPVDYVTPLMSPSLREHTGAFARYRDRDGVEVVGTSVGIAGPSWRFVAEFPVEEALGPLVNLRRLSAIFAVVFAVLLLVTAWLVAGGIVAPVRLLLDATRRVTAGDLDVEVEVEERNEIGELGRAFNEMTHELARASDRVEELHRREIERAQQLATVGELASGVAHEIKNPVMGLSNGLDLVRRRIETDGDLGPIMDEMNNLLERIELAVRDLLAFARPPEPSLAPVDGNAVVRRVLRLVEPEADRRAVTISFHPHPSLPEIQADEELLRQALVNLVMNAIQATSPGGRVAVATRVYDGMVHFETSDTGRGVPAEQLEEIFRPFFTTRHNGSGLGLSISREIVERHGGRIEVESRVGEGSTFTVVLPRER